MKTKLTPLQKGIKKLLKEDSAYSVFQELVKEVRSYESDDEQKWLLDEMILHLNMVGYNVVKTETLADQITFEEQVKNIYPFLNEQQINLHLSY